MTDHCFDRCDEDAYAEHFASHGVVVVRDVLTSDECESTLREFLNSPALMDGRVDPHKPASWADWQREKHGFLDPQPGHTQAELKHAWLNRQNPRLVRVFSQLLGEERLLVTCDRFSLMPPTWVEGQEYPERRTASGCLHWDQNPWSHPEFLGLQGLVCLTDHTASSGGFCCTPGFTQTFAEWGQSHPPSKDSERSYSLVRVPLEDPLHARVVNVHAPAGSVVIWDSRTPHCNFPNNDSTMRACQYISYSASTRFGETNANLEDAKQLISASTPDMPFPACLSLLGQKLTGLADWNAEDLVSLGELTESLDPAEQEAWELVRQAEELESQGEYQESIRLYKAAARTSRKVADARGL